MTTPLHPRQIVLAGLVLFLLALAPSSGAAEAYQLLIYPNAADIGEYLYGGTFATVKEARKRLARYNECFPGCGYEIDAVLPTPCNLRPPYQGTWIHRVE